VVLLAIVIAALVAIFCARLVTKPIDELRATPA